LHYIIHKKLLTMTVTIEKTTAAGRFVETSHVDMLIRNYKKERWIQATERLGKEDSLSVWYTVEELENFLQKIKTHGADGVRMFYGVYDAGFEEVPDYAGRQTVVLVATKSRIQGDKIVEKHLYVNNGNDTSILAYNRGKLCPPECPIGGDEDWGGLGMAMIERKGKGITIV
jgi:hypothetical protein